MTNEIPTEVKLHPQYIEYHCGTVFQELFERLFAAEDEIEIGMRALIRSAFFGLGRFGGFGAFLQERILRNGLVQFLHTFECRKLQQLNRLLQPGCQGELLF